MMAMNPEERFDRLERQKEFLAASRARHEARMAEISTNLAETSGRITQLTDLTLRIGRIVERQAIRMDELTGRMDELTGRLNALIIVVERYLSRN